VQEFRQCGALPIVEVDGAPQILLITSRRTLRWVIPKGWPKSGVTPDEQAAQEAFEEAGVSGRISKTALGSYSYTKRLHVFAWARVTVDVFPLLVDRQSLTWPESNSRTLRWFSLAQASQNVRERDLAALILRLSSGTYSAEAQGELDPEH
jgi:8-oxo-dGTP pyrophosphatase MutT (NUDIX family)